MPRWNKLIMEGINFGWLAVWDLCQEPVTKATYIRRLGKTTEPGEGSAGRAQTLHRILWHLPYNWGKSRKTSVRVTEKRSARQRRARFVWSTWPSQAMASTGPLPPAALGSRVRRQGQPSVSLSICRIAVLGGSPSQLTFSQSSRLGLWCDRQRAEHPDPRVSACYLSTRGHE
jgi:hypothetical protein